MSLSYLINQSSKFIWYSAHYIISFKYATPIKIDKSNPPPFYGKMPSGRKLFFEISINFCIKKPDKMKGIANPNE